MNKTIASFGFNFPISCNYPEAAKFGEIVIQNSKFMMSEATPKQISNIFTHQGPANFTLRNNTFVAFINPPEWLRVWFNNIGAAVCNPSVGT